MSNVPYTDTGYSGYDEEGNIVPVKGLGLSDYYIWNLNGSNFYYGANFVDYVGKINDSIVMVRPSNGRGYDSFIFGQYFDVVVNGSPAPTLETVRVIGLIDELPAVDDIVSLTDELLAATNAARAAYDAITSLEQQALVTNYSTLRQVESVIAYLQNQQTPPEHTEHVDADGDGLCDECGEKMPGSEELNPRPSEQGNFFADNMYGLIIAGVLLVVVIGLVVYIIIDKKNKKQ